MSNRSAILFMVILLQAWLSGCQQIKLSPQSNLDTTCAEQAKDQPTENASLNGKRIVNSNDETVGTNDLPKWEVISSQRVTFIGQFRPGHKGGHWLDRPSGRVDLEFEKEDWSEQLRNQRVLVEGDLEERRWTGGGQQGMTGFDGNKSRSWLRVSSMRLAKEPNGSFVSEVSR